MRLINCDTMKFEEFYGAKRPAYAILSHTWEFGEVLFDDFLCKNMNQKEQTRKVVKTCHLAREHNYHYVWIDTCCIDKTSSAELTEAVNSMFSWYSTSGRCFVYLSDFDSKNATSDLTRCRWFTRGWTLQELIASPDILFYDQNWHLLGSKTELGTALSSITGIERPILNGEYPLFVVSVAKKMSWAAQRETTREEDLAYCLLGIFGISMSLVYGEGARAFMRLQEEIIKETNDLTLFAWLADPLTSRVAPYRGALATSPKEFAHAGDIVSSTNIKNNPEFAMTNKGVKIQARLSRGHGNSVLMPLNCHRTSAEHNTIGIYLVDVGSGVFVRDLPQRLESHSTGGLSRSDTIYIMRHVKDVRYL
jgi:hypothetical protein